MCIRDSCIIGPNGSGKTSLLRTIIGYYPIDNSTLVKFGEFNLKMDEQIIKMNLAFVSDSDSINLEFNGNEFINFVHSFYINSKKSSLRLEQLVRIYDMEKYLDNRISTYSHGMIKKLMLITYLSLDVDYYILDEPFN